jgi:hypothetical protein
MWFGKENFLEFMGGEVRSLEAGGGCEALREAARR